MSRTSLRGRIGCGPSDGPGARRSRPPKLVRRADLPGVVRRACQTLLESNGTARVGSAGDPVERKTMSVTETRQFLGFYADESEAERLRQLATEADRSLSAELRRAVGLYLDENRDED